jgi:hypothetical protein
MQANIASFQASQTHQTDNHPQDIPLGMRGIPGRRVLGSSKSRLFGAILRASHRWVRWYGFLRETHSYLCRIRVVLESNVYLFGQDAGPAFQETEAGGLALCRSTQQRMKDMQQVAEDESFPWEPTPIDFVLFLRGWEAGERWAREDCTSDNKRRSAG